MNQTFVDKFLADYDNDFSAEFEFTAEEFTTEAVGESLGISTFSFDLSPEDSGTTSTREEDEVEEGKLYSCKKCPIMENISGVALKTHL
jgi:hypothetical protein